MKKLLFTATGQRLQRDNQNGGFSGIQRGWKHYLSCSFTFDSDWNGMAKVAEFNDVLTPDEVLPVLLVNDSCDVPDEMSGIRFWQVRIVGQNRKGDRLTTNRVGVIQNGVG